MKSIVFFNNKGGVGKTTLACNLVSYLNIYLNKKVLLIDADPQCNATQAILPDEINEEIYLNDNATYNTLFTSLRPFGEGDCEIKTDFDPLPANSNRFKTDIIPGHPLMSIIEDQLSDAWSYLKGRETRGYRITNWCFQLTEHFKNEYDYIVFDVGPSLGALNRSIILASDYIITPFGCDIFSLLGIKNIAQWIKNWKQQYDSSVMEVLKTNPDMFEKYQIIQNTDSKFRFAGYSAQQYVTRHFKTGPRPVKSYDKIMSDIPTTIEESLKFLYRKNYNTDNYALGHIPYLYSLIPMSQSAKAPIFDLKGTDGLVGSQYAQVEAFSQLLEKISEQLIKNIEDNDDVASKLN